MRWVSKNILAMVGVGVVFAILYHLTATRAFSYDSLCYSLDMEVGSLSNLFHPNHLLYSVIGRFIYRFFALIGHPLRALLLMQHTNALVGGLVVGIFSWMLARDFGWPRALIGAAALGLSNSFWTEMVDPGCYAWAMLATCLLLGAIIKSEGASPFWIGVVHGVAVLFHQMLVLVIPAFLVKLGRRRAGPYLAGVMLTVGLPYLLVGALFHGDSLVELLRWTVAPAGGPKAFPFFFFWNFDVSQNVIYAWQGFVHSWMAPSTGEFSWNSLSGQAGVFLLVLFLVWASVRYFKKKKLIGDLLAALWVWILAMNVFQFFHLPGAQRFRLLFLLPTIYMVLFLSRSLRWPDLTGRLAGRQIRAMGWGSCVVGALLWVAHVNYHGLIGPQSRAENNLNFVRALWVSHLLQPNDAFIFSGSVPQSIVNVYVAYFAPHVRGRSVRGYFFGNPKGDLAVFRQLVADARQAQQRVFVEATLFEAEEQKALETVGGVPPGTLRAWFSTLRKRQDWTGPGGYKLFEVS